MKNIQNWYQFNENNNIDNFLNEKKMTELQKKYRLYFKEMLAIYNVNSPAELSKNMKKDFFKNIRKYWIKGVGPSKIGEELIDAIKK